MADYFEYTTMQGDTFDILALDAYNDETKAHLIIQANPKHAGTLIFESGTVLKIPIVSASIAETLPPWKR